ncbi:pentapeptide repeat-containing protein [Pendulispora albinea]|uniref:Pentapeptide repeat-containing protein n=1 Tax=Pendulispora albinea TaxID=2741071 RepID=A0ABZ2M7W0_9BACT
MASREQLRTRWEGQGDLLGAIVQRCVRGEPWASLLHERDFPFVNEVSRGRDLRGAPLAGVQLVGVDLSGADLSDADLRAADLCEATLIDAILRDVRAAEATLWRADLCGADLRDADLTKVNGYQVNLRGACLDGARLIEAYFEQANIYGASLLGANVFGSRFPRANLARSRMGNARAEGADFTEADLSEADLEGAQLSGALCAGATLSAAVLRMAKLASVDLSRADLEGARLLGADLRSANLSHANCRHVLWAEANLEGANLSGAALYNSTIFLAQGLDSVSALNVDVGSAPDRPSLQSWTDFVGRLRGLYGEDGVTTRNGAEAFDLAQASPAAQAADGNADAGKPDANGAGNGDGANGSTPLFSQGSLFGRYVIDELLGEGGMGRVYRALDTRLGRRIALKVLPSSDRTGDGANRASRLEREARTTALIDSPYAVAIFDVGDVDGHPFIAMELVSGHTLSHYTHAPQPGWAKRVRWLVQMASALEAAHRVGIVHRDVKPENVMIREDGIAKVLDFGVARRLLGTHGQMLPSPELLATVTVEGAPIGTPLYMAPEQIRGELADGRTDQFAWGVTAYELLANRSPWIGNSYSILAKILTESPAPLRSLAPSVPEGVERAVTRAMSKTRDARYPTMAALVAELAPFAESFDEPGQHVLPLAADPP